MVSRWRVIAQGVGAMVVGGAAAIATAAADTERIGTIWTSAAFDTDGSAAIVEVIDYDFGSHSRHGILRDIDDLEATSPMDVSSPDAPDLVTVSGGTSFASLRIGDPDETVRNRRRYRIAYRLDTLAIPDEGVIRWDAVGTRWPVSVRRAEIHVVAPFALESAQCFRGASGSAEGCTVTQPEPGHLTAVVTGLGSFEGTTIEATRGEAVGRVPELPSEPAGPADDPGWWWLWAGLSGAGLALAPAMVVWPVQRHRGRERVWAGGSVAAAFGPGVGAAPTVELLHPEQLDELATTEFAAPPQLSAATGGIIHAEGVLDRHKVAWLIERAIAEEVTIDEHEGDEHVVTLRRGSALPSPAVASDLDAMFAGRDSVALGTYDEAFAEGWAQLEKHLEEWRKDSGLWDAAGGSREDRAMVRGASAVLLGLAGTVLFSVFASRTGGNWIWLAAGCMVLAGFGLAALIGSDEHTVRTPEGSAHYLQVESFRRFIAASEGHHAAAAARMGVLLQYTAWAVAIDELDHWNAAVAAAALGPKEGIDPGALRALSMTSIAASLASGVSSASTAPSSSSSGGGGSFSGGGGGGGGGGSW